MKKTTQQVFEFWKENKTDQHYTLTPEEIKQKFAEWLPTKGKEWVDYYDTMASVLEFTSHKAGLNSVMGAEQIEPLFQLLKPARLAYLEAEEKKEGSAAR